MKEAFPCIYTENYRLVRIIFHISLLVCATFWSFSQITSLYTTDFSHTLSFSLFIFVLCIENLEWRTMRNALSSPGIAVIVNGRSSWRELGGGFIISRATMAVRVDCQSFHQTAEDRRSSKLLRSWRFIWFWPTMGPVLELGSQCKCKLWITPLHASKL